MREHLIMLETVSTASWTRPKTVTWQPSASSDYNPRERTRARDATWGHEGTCCSQCCGRLVCVDDGVVCSRSQERRPFLEARLAVVMINRGCSVTVMQAKRPSQSPWHAFQSETWTHSKSFTCTGAIVSHLIRRRSREQTLAQERECVCRFFLAD